MTALLDAAAYRAAHRVLTGDTAGDDRRQSADPSGPGPAGGAATVDGVFCHNCGHRNPAGRQFLLVVRRRPAQAGSADTTITLQPVDDHGEPAEEERRRHPGRRAPGHRAAGGQAGPQRGGPLPARTEVTRAGRHPESDIFLDDITVSRRHAEFEQSHGGWSCATWARSTARTSTGSASRQVTVLPAGDEVQIGKFKLVYLVAGDE